MSSPTGPVDYLRSTHHDFLPAAADALANPQLQVILGRLAETLGEKNRAAWAALPNSDLVRERARGLKELTLQRLDEHLAKLEESVIARGGKVHWAADGEEACRIILELINAMGYRRVVKSKSMTSEEIHLNPC